MSTDSARYFTYCRYCRTNATSYYLGKVEVTEILISEFKLLHKEGELDNDTARFAYMEYVPCQR